MMNSDNFNANGTIKRGPKRWAKSGRYQRRQHSQTQSHVEEGLCVVTPGML